MLNKISAGESFGTEVAVGSELLQAAQTSQAAAQATPSVSSSDVPMAGFGAGVHLYLNQLLTVLYSKTTTLLAANMVLTSLLLTARLAHTWVGEDFFYIGAICCFASSAITSTSVLFPRLHHHDAEGLIFWKAILSKPTPSAYYTSVQALDKARVEEEYAKDNWHVSRTIRFKDTLLRVAIGLFICGMSFAVIGVAGPLAFKHL